MPFLVYGGLAIFFFWPLILQLGHGLHDRSDTTLNTWILGWQAHILPRDPLALFAAPIFYPLRTSLALSEIIWPAAPMSVPLLAATGNPVLVYNLLFLATFFIAGLGAYALALHLTGSRPAALLAGIIYAFSPHQLGHLSQIQLLHIGWLPLVLLSLDRFWCRRNRRDGFLLALFITAQSLSAFYYAFQVVLVVGLYIMYRLVSVPGRRGLATAGATLAWCLLAAAIMLPFTLPYLQVRAQLGLERSLEGTLAYAPPLTDYLLPRPDNPLYSPVLAKIFPRGAIAGGGLFLGVAPVGLAVAGLSARRRAADNEKGVPAVGLAMSPLFWLLVLFSSAILSLGPRLKLVPGDPGGLPLPFNWLYQHVPGLTAIRAPGRFGVTVFLALAILAAFGLARLLRMVRTPVGRIGMLGVVSLLCLGEYAGGLGQFTVQPMPELAKSTPVYTWLAGQPEAVIAELPLTSEMAEAPLGQSGTGPDDAWPDYNVMRYQYFGLIHWQRSIDGYSGFTPPHHRELGLTLANFPSERSVAGLRGLGVRYVIVHSRLVDAYRPGWALELRGLLDRMTGIRHTIDFGADWVYEILPGDMPPVSGRFWSSGQGNAFLILKTEGAGAAVFSPDVRLPISGAWEERQSGRKSPLYETAPLPLLVEDTSVLALPIPKPERTGSYTLTLASPNGPIAIANYANSMEVPGAAASPEYLLPLRLMEPSLPPRLTPGSSFSLVLRWQLLDRPEGDYSVSARLEDADGRMVRQDDRALSGGQDLVRAWEPGQAITTTHKIDLPPDALGRYIVRIFVYRPGDPATFYWFGGQEEPQSDARYPLLLKPAVTPDVELPPPSPAAQFGNLYLLAVEAEPPAHPGEPFTIRSSWTAGQGTQMNYTLFAHLVSPDGKLLAQQDQQPQAGRYPTSVWEPGESVQDVMRIEVPPAAAGEIACLRMGLYDAQTSVRLQRRDTPGDFWQAEGCWELLR